MFIFGVSVIDNALHELGQVGKGLRKSVKTRGIFLLHNRFGIGLYEFGARPPSSYID